MHLLLIVSDSLDLKLRCRAIGSLAIATHLRGRHQLDTIGSTLTSRAMRHLATAD